MSKGVVIKYDCGQCGERHDHEDGAIECCQPEIDTVSQLPHLRERARQQEGRRTVRSGSRRS